MTDLTPTALSEARAAPAPSGTRTVSTAAVADATKDKKLYLSIGVVMKTLQDEGTPSEFTKSVGELIFIDLKQLAGKIYKKLKEEKVDNLAMNGTRATQQIIMFILYKRKQMDKTEVFPELSLYGTENFNQGLYPKQR